MELVAFVILFDWFFLLCLDEGSGSMGGWENGRAKMAFLY